MLRCEMRGSGILECVTPRRIGAEADEMRVVDEAGLHVVLIIADENDV